MLIRIISAVFGYVYRKIKSLSRFEREIICVSNNNITNKKVGVHSIIVIVLFVFWSAFATIGFFEMTQKNIDKEYKISSLEDKQQKLLSNIAILDDEIKKVTHFINSLNKYDRIKEVVKNENFSLEKDFNNANVDIVLNRSNNNVNGLGIALKNRIKHFELVAQKMKFQDMDLASLDEEKEVNENIDDELTRSLILRDDLNKNMHKLNTLESFINELPLIKPMEYIRVSSRFGIREDPFNKEKKMHKGLDLVGPYLSNIYAPADGKVIFTGTKGGYGKVVVVQHANDFKTIYGHLDSIKVKVGDNISRNDIIGIQGNTGRSTGDHLHYEIVRGRNFIYDPVDIIDIGSSLF
jgi:murein DD-endopeptidase MepM/ murein hydrolase activator NlpD